MNSFSVSTAVTRSDNEELVILQVALAVEFSVALAVEFSVASMCLHYGFLFLRGS